MFFEAISTKLWPLAYYAYYLLYVIYTFCFRQTTSEIFCLPCAHRGHDTLGHSQLLWPHLLRSRRCWPSHSAATMRVCLTTCAIRLWMSWIILTFRKVFWGHSNALELIRSIFKQDRNSPRQRKQSRLPEGAGNWPEGPEGGLLFKPNLQPCLQGFLQLFHLCSPRLWYPTVGHFIRKFVPLLLLLLMPEHLHFTVLPKHVLRRALSRSAPFHQLQQPAKNRCRVAGKIDES